MSTDAATTVTTPAPSDKGQAQDGTPVPATRSEESTHAAVRGWWLVALIVAGFVLQVAWRFWLARSVPTPVAHADEDRYLLSARVLAGGPGGDGNDTTAFRRMGYPLLLAPIYYVTSDPFKVYHAAQAIGAVVNALTFPLAYLFARRVLSIKAPLALGLAFVAGTLPAVAYYSEFALTDAIFAPLGLGWLLLLHGWLAGRTGWSRTLAAAGAGVVVGYAYAVHVRGIILLGIHLITLAAVLVRQRSRWRPAVVSAVVAIVVGQVNWLTGQLIGDRMQYGGQEPQGRMFERILTARGLVHTLCDAAGQIWYAGVATWGLAAVGLIVAVSRVRGRGSDQADGPQRVVLAVALAATALIAISSAAALPADGRVSNHVYFRYIAFLMPVWVTLGAVALIRAGRSRALRFGGQVAALLAVGAFLVLSQMSELYSEWFHPFDTPEVSFITYSWRALPVARAAVTGLLLFLVFALALSARTSWRPAVLGLAAVLALNVATLEVVNAKSVGPMAGGEYGTAPLLVRDAHLHPGDVVVAAEQVPLGPKMNHQREVYWDVVARFDSVSEGPPAGATAVIAPWQSKSNGHWDGEPLGWHRVAEDPAKGWAVWLRDGDPRINAP